MDTLSKIHDYYGKMIDQVQLFAMTFGSGDLWTFLMCSSYVDYLVKMVNNTEETGSNDYKEFIRLYLFQIDKRYKDIKYKSGTQDLPEQMYHVLRCGITHSFSLIPDKKSTSKGGRPRSIVLGHRKQGEIHLTPYTENGNDSEIFTIEDLPADLKKVLDLIFKDIAPTNSLLENNILNWVKTYPPIQQL